MERQARETIGRDRRKRWSDRYRDKMIITHREERVGIVWKYEDKKAVNVSFYRGGGGGGGGG